MITLKRLNQKVISIINGVHMARIPKGMGYTVGIWLVRLPQTIELSTDLYWRINYIQCYAPYFNYYE